MLTHGSAVISEDGLYRYRLDRWWGDGPRVAWVMLNPSTADDQVDDPTIRRCMGFTRAWGYNGMTVVNLYPFRSSDPATLETWLDGEPTDEMNVNTAMIIAVARDAPLLVAAWGATRGEDGAACRQFLSQYVTNWHHLGLTQDGYPRHPLYLRRDEWPRSWSLE